MHRSDILTHIQSFVSPIEIHDKICILFFASIAVNMHSSQSWSSYRTQQQSGFCTSIIHIEKDPIRTTLDFPLAKKHKNIMKGK